MTAATSPTSTHQDTPVPTGPPRSHRGTTALAGKVKLPPVVWLLGAVSFVMSTSSLIVAGLLPQISDSLGVSVSSAGLLITVYALGMGIGAPVMSLATLRLPHRSAMIAALLVFAAGHILGALSSNLALALVGRFAAALGNGTFWVMGAVVATTAAGPAARTRAMSVMVGGMTLANAVGVPLGTAAGQLVGWQALFWTLALLSLAATVVVARRVPADTGGGDSSLRAELGALKHPRLWLVYLAAALMQGGLLAFYSYIAPLLTERAGLSTTVLPLAMLGYGAGALAGTAFGGRRGDRRPYATLIPAAAVTAILLAAITLWATNSVTAVILLVLLGAVGISTTPILVGQVIRIVGPGRALPVALTTSAFQVGIASGSWIGGVALTSALGLKGPSLVGLALALAALLPLSLLAAASQRTAGAAVLGGSPSTPHSRDSHLHPPHA